MPDKPGWVNEQAHRSHWRIDVRAEEHGEHHEEVFLTQGRDYETVVGEHVDVLERVGSAVYVGVLTGTIS